MSTSVDPAPSVPPPSSSTASADARNTTVLSPPPAENHAPLSAAGSSSRVTANRPPLRLFMTVLHLAALGVVGSTLLVALFGTLGAGLGMILVVGIGLVILVALVYALFGVAWFESQRVAGLYHLDIAPIRWRAMQRPGFKGWLSSLGKQTIDGRMWRSLANFAIVSMMGVAVVGMFRVSVHLVIELFWPTDGEAHIVNIVLALLLLAGIVGLALLHRIISITIMSVGAKEEALSARVRTTTKQREGAVRAADVERTRIERDLHDGVQPRLVSVGMTLGLAQRKIDTDPVAAKELIAEAHTSTKAAITELRQLARGIYASVLDDRGLDAALSAVAARSHIPVHLDVRIGQRCSRVAEAAVYFAIAESLTNAAKHSRASETRVTVRTRDDGTLWARVEDNGIGGANVLAGGGLDGVINRVIAAGGTSRLDSPQGGPTALEVSVPCAS